MTDTAPDTAISTAIQPYICVSPAGEAIAWYHNVFGAIETIRYTGDDGRIGHAEISIGGATVMLSDPYPELEVVSPRELGGTPVTLHLVVPDVDAVYERAVEAGGRVAGEPKDESYGARSFSMIDPFGHRWMVQTPVGTRRPRRSRRRRPTTPSPRPRSPRPTCDRHTSVSRGGLEHEHRDDPGGAALVVGVVGDTPPRPAPTTPCARRR